MDCENTCERAQRENASNYAASTHASSLPSLRVCFHLRRRFLPSSTLTPFAASISERSSWQIQRANVNLHRVLGSWGLGISASWVTRDVFTEVDLGAIAHYSARSSFACSEGPAVPVFRSPVSTRWSRSTSLALHSVASRRSLPRAHCECFWPRGRTACWWSSSTSVSSSCGSTESSLRAAQPR